MGWILGAGLLLVVFAFKGRGAARPQAPAAPRAQPSVVSQAAAAPSIPSPVPAGPDVTVLAQMDAQPGQEVILNPSSSILTPASAEPGAQVILNPDAVPGELLGVVRAGQASDQDLERAMAASERLGRADLVTYFRGLLERRRAAARTFDIRVDPEPDHDPTSGQPVSRLEMVEREVAPAPRGDRTVRVSQQSDALPTARMDRGQLHALALRVADNLRRTTRRRYDRTLVRTFQRGAGLAADGDYGNRTRQALGYYGQIPAAQLPPSQY